MKITLNGRQQDLSGPAVVADLVQAVCGTRDGTGLAVALDGVVVPRSRWESTGVRDGARVDVVTAVQGG